MSASCYRCSYSDRTQPCTCQEPCASKLGSHLCEGLPRALAAAELRGAQRQREADVKALLDIASTFRSDSTIRVYLEASAARLNELPLAASPEETQP